MFALRNFYSLTLIRCKGYEFLSKKALDIYLKRVMEHFEAEQRKKIVKEKN
ncbi:MAG: hypothetical protein QW279_15450 [Candidatus Jordarchaeaceae archaeon]